MVQLVRRGFALGEFGTSSLSFKDGKVTSKFAIGGIHLEMCTLTPHWLTIDGEV